MISKSSTAALVAVIALGVEACGGATDDQGPVDGVQAALVFTIQHPDIDGYSYAISCEDGQTEVQGPVDIHPDAACEALADPVVQERLVQGPPGDRVCTRIYGGPDTARIQGNIDGQVFDTVIDRTDGCAISDWDELLNPLLPEPIGVTD